MKNNCYIISYSISNSANIANLETAIKAYGTWAKITHETWAIVTTQSAVQVRDSLQPHITGGAIFVVKSGVEAAWGNVECSNEWLKRNL